MRILKEVNYLKKFYRENRIFVLMMGVVLICLIIITSLLLVYFYKGNSKDKYGDRLKDIETKITDSEIKDKVTETKKISKITDAKINVFGKIIYINLYFEDETEIIEAEGKAVTALDNFSDEEKSVYDFQFILYEKIGEETFIISGAKNHDSPTIIWNNNKEE